MRGINGHHALGVPSSSRATGRIDRIVVALNHLEQRGVVRSWFVRSEPGEGRRWVVEWRGPSTRVHSTREVEQWIRANGATL